MNYAVSNEFSVCVKSNSNSVCEEKKTCNYVELEYEEPSLDEFCNKQPVLKANIKTHKCVQNYNLESPCIEVEKECVGEYENCELYPVSFTNRNLYVCKTNPETQECYEELKKCNDVTVLEDKSCPDFPTEKEGYSCVKSFSSHKPCEEKQLCQGADVSNEDNQDEACKTLYISSDKVNDHFCEYDEEKRTCVEAEKQCSEINQKSKECSGYATSGDKYACTDDPDNPEGCKEELLCNGVESITSDSDCMKYPVSSENSICVKSDSNLVCEEKTMCNYVEQGSEELTDDLCQKNPVSKENINTHICIKDKNENKCIEQYLCESVPNSTDETEIDCSIYPVKNENKDTHKCVKSTNGQTPCIEQEIINTIISTSLIPTTFPSTKIKSDSTFQETDTITNSNSLSDISTTEFTEIEKTITTTSIPSTIKSTEIEKTTTTNSMTSTIETTEITATNATELNKTTINENTNQIVINIPPTATIEETKNTQALVVFFGFSQFKKLTSLFSFMVHFMPIRYYLFSKYLVFPLYITYNTYLRYLEESYANCTLDGTNTNTDAQSIVNYYCEVKTETGYIKQIRLQPDFNFTRQNNVTIVGMTPFAKMFLNNIQNIDSKYDELLKSNQTIFIIDNSTLIKYENDQFTINGTMIGNGPKTSLKGKDLVLLTNIESDEDNVTKELNCTVIDIINKNYTLNCKANKNIEYNLQSAISIIDEGILLVNFDTLTNNENNTVLFEQNKTTEVTKKYYHNYYKKSKGLNAGSIIAIILSLVAALVAIIGIFICLQKRANKVEHSESSIVKLQN